MDIHKTKESVDKNSAVESSRPITVLAERNNETTHRSRTREISSRYMSPTPTAPSGPRRYPSPHITRPSTPPRQSVPKRAISAERKRPSTPPSPPKLSTPLQDTTLDTRLASRQLASNKMPEGLWPSTIRSLNASFQEKKETPLPNSVPDRALRPSSNVSRKPEDTPNVSRKPKETSNLFRKHEEAPVVSRRATPERGRSPLKGKNAPDHSENSKPIDVLHSRLVEQHMWPSRTRAKLPSSPTSRSMDHTNKDTKTPWLNQGCGNSEFDSYKPVSSRLLATPGARSQSLPKTPGGSRASSPSKAPKSVSRGASPFRTRAMNRGVSPSRQSCNSNTSVLTFIADIKKEKRGANHIEDIHELRLLYNRHLQWRYANARANTVLHSQKIKAEKMLYNVSEMTSELWDFVIEKRNYLQQLKLRLKLHTVLSEHMPYLESWGSCENEHTSTLSLAIEDLRSNILHLPVTGRARGDIETVKAAVGSAIDVMRAMGSSVSFILARVEGMNSQVSQLADVAARGRAMIYGCEALLASIAALQVEEYSLRTQLIQMKEN